MDAGDLAVFAAVARAGGMTKAAARLNTVQSNVTQRVRRLEAELGVPLFHRHSRGVSLTSAGSQLLPYAERIGRLIGEAKQAAADGPVPRGRISIGALETATAVRLPPVLAAYAAACPEVDIEIATGTSAALVEAVLEHRLDAAFVAGPVSQAELLALPMAEEELVVVTAPDVGGRGGAFGSPGGRGGAFGSPGGLDGLARSAGPGKVKLVVFRPGCTYRARLEALLAARDIADARWLEFGTLDGIIGCVGAGIGATLLPRAVVAQAAADGRVALHALPPDEARVETVLVRRRDAYVSTALARFIETARERLTAGDAAHRAAARAGPPAATAATPDSKPGAGAPRPTHRP